MSLDQPIDNANTDEHSVPINTYMYYIYGVASPCEFQTQIHILRPSCPHVLYIYCTCTCLYMYIVNYIKLKI